MSFHNYFLTIFKHFDNTSILTSLTFSFEYLWTGILSTQIKALIDR